MPFEYYSPGPHLTAYIHTYWTLKGDGLCYDVLYPDGCVDIIANLGDRFTVAQKNVVLEEEGVYLGGALTEAIYEQIPVGVHLLGVRFRPGCFGCFYPLVNLSDLQDHCVRVQDALLPSLYTLRTAPGLVLDTFYATRLKAFDHPLKYAMEEISRLKGNASLGEIASACNRSPRQTERLFKLFIGLSPKQFCRIVKYVYSQQLLDRKLSSETLLEIALEAGYYDHAHLAKEYKKITQRNPSGK